MTNQYDIHHMYKCIYTHFLALKLRKFRVYFPTKANGINITVLTISYNFHKEIRTKYSNHRSKKLM